MSKKVRQQAAIQALISNSGIKDAAHVCGIAEKTLRRWLKEEEFAAELRQAQQEISMRVTRAVIARAEGAAAVLDEIMNDKKTSPHARVAAARTLLENGLKAIETADILARIEELEAKNEQGIY